MNQFVLLYIMRCNGLMSQTIIEKMQSIIRQIGLNGILMILMQEQLNFK